MLVKRKILLLIIVIALLVLCFIFFKKSVTGQDTTFEQQQHSVLSQKAVVSAIPTITQPKGVEQSTRSSKPSADCATQVDGKLNLGSVCSINELEKEQ